MLTKKHLTKLALAVGLGAALVASASSASMARPLSTNGAFQSDQGFAWAPSRSGYADVATHARARAARPTPQDANGPGPHYYEGDDNGTVWSYYQGYRPLR